MAAARVVLASASPRRRELLGAAGLTFEVAPTSIDEELGEFSDPTLAALELATRKAFAAARARTTSERTWYIGSDTIVALPTANGTGWSLLGKPADEREADAMLASLSGSRHAVITGVCVVSAPEMTQRRASECTWVTMRPISAPERAAYVASQEWRDKAGGYAIQENADRFVTRLEQGGFDNVVGLPVALTLRLLRESGASLP